LNTTQEPVAKESLCHDINAPRTMPRVPIDTRRCLQQNRRSDKQRISNVVLAQNGISIILALGSSCGSVQRGSPEAELLVVDALTTILSIVRGNEAAQVAFREQYRDVMTLVHHCMASGTRVQRSVLEVVLRLALETEYTRQLPVPEVWH
jgi:hypothetical protein